MMKIKLKRRISNLFSELGNDYQLFLLLTLFAYLGNYFHLHLFFGIHFLFGSIAIWLIVWRYGSSWGIFASLIASFHTFLLWGHPYAIIIFTLETTLVSIFWKRKNYNLIILDGLYWLVVGMPLVWIFYRGVMSINNISTLLILLKQPVNGLFNSLIVSLIINFISRNYRKSKFRELQNNLSLKQTLFNILVAFIFFPALIVMVLDGRGVLKQIEIDISNNLVSNRVSISHLVEQWHDEYELVLTETIQAVNKSKIEPSLKLELLLKTLPDLNSIILVRHNESERFFLSPTKTLIKSLEKNQKYSCEIKSNTLIEHSIYFEIPIVTETNSSSCFLAQVKSQKLNKLIQPVTNITNLQISLLDSNNRLIVGNEISQNQVNLEQGIQKAGIEQVHQWFPDNQKLPLMVKWSKSLYWQEENINSEITWKIRVLIPAKTYIYTLQKHYIINLALMLALSLIALIISSLISGSLIAPLSDLAKITKNLPKKLFANLTKGSHRDSLKVNVPQNSAIEIYALIDNFNSMSEILSQKIQEIYHINQTLAQKTAQLAKANQELESRTILLQKTQEAAEVANRAKSTFIANMSHELRTPLNSVLGFARLMNCDSNLTPKQQSNLDIINRSGEHLLSLINDILNLAKIESGHMTLNSTSFDFHMLLNTVEEMFILKAKNKGIELIGEYSLDLPNYIKTDEKKLRQVLINLLNNAIKFTPEGKVILRISSVRDDEKLIKINGEIEDTGDGIAPEEFKNLFKPFVQTATGKKIQEGTGLGLPISRKFIQLMGGELTISSILGKGTIAKFDFLVEPTTTKAIQNHNSCRKVVGLQSGQPNYRILVVDDIWENRQLLLQILQSVGFEVSEAENGREAISIWSSWQPHVILMDMRMPVLDGYQATQEIRSHSQGKDTIVIALTATAFEAKCQDMIAAGCNDYVCKPFHESIIWDKMTKYLGVNYVYADSPPHSIANKSFKLETSALEMMPTEWIDELEKATLELNEALIAELLQQIPDEHILLTQALQNRLENFDLDSIFDLARGAIDSKLSS